jgi:hypothetical protein
MRQEILAADRTGETASRKGARGCEVPNWAQKEGIHLAELLEKNETTCREQTLLSTTSENISPLSFLPRTETHWVRMDTPKAVLPGDSLGGDPEINNYKSRNNFPVKINFATLRTLQP